MAFGVLVCLCKLLVVRWLGFGGGGRLAGIIRVLCRLRWAGGGGRFTNSALFAGALLGSNAVAANVRELLPTDHQRSRDGV